MQRLVLSQDLRVARRSTKPVSVDLDRLATHLEENPQLAARKRYMAAQRERRGLVVEGDHGAARALQATARIRRRLALDKLLRRRLAGFSSPVRLTLHLRLDHELIEKGGF